ncbi:MAG: multicopper oxidase domain-containing protein [Thermomicrobiales bacterium]
MNALLNQSESNAFASEQDGLVSRASAFRIARTVFFAAMLVSAVAMAIWATSDAGSETHAQQVKEFTLVAEEIDWELQSGITVKAWAYNGQVPGPEIRVTEGDLVRVTFVNRLPAASTIHFHGVNLTPDMDGPVGLNQAAVEPGESFTYEFVATPSGTRWFHSHTDVANQVMLGLYGSFIVEPKDPQIAFDREYTYVLSEWDVELTPDVALGLAPRGPRDSQLRGGELGTDYFLFNGKMHDSIPPMLVTEGDRVLIRLINAGTTSHPFHTHGHSFKVVATDGNFVPEAAQITKDTIMIAPGERYDLLMVADNPGVWMVHCHIENHADNGMMTIIQYEGVLPSGPLAEGWNPDTGGLAVPSKDGAMSGASHMGHGQPALATPEIEIVETDPHTATGEVASGDVTVALVDNRFVPQSVTVATGTTVTFVNNGGNWHSVLGGGGSIKSGQIGSGQTFTHTFDAAGTYKVVCTQHLRQGMTAEIIVVDDAGS